MILAMMIVHFGNPTAMVAYGDSITSGWNGADFAITPQVSLMASRRSMTLANNARGGMTLPWSSDPAGGNLFGANITDGTLYWLGHGFGENAFMPDNVQITENFRSELLSCASWLAVRDSRKVKGNGSTYGQTTIVKTGNWLDTPYYSFGCQSSSGGSKVTISNITGQRFIIGMTGADPNHSLSAGSFTISVDGKPAYYGLTQWSRTFDIPLGAVPSWNYIPMGIVINTPLYGCHVIEINVTSVSGWVEFDWMASLDQLSSCHDGGLVMAGVTMAGTNERNDSSRYGGEYFKRLERINRVIHGVATSVSYTHLRAHET